MPFCAAFLLVKGLKASKYVLGVQGLEPRSCYSWDVTCIWLGSGGMQAVCSEEIKMERSTEEF